MSSTRQSYFLRGAKATFSTPPHSRIKGHGGAPYRAQTPTKIWQPVHQHHGKPPPKRRGRRCCGWASVRTTATSWQVTAGKEVANRRPRDRRATSPSPDTLRKPPPPPPGRTGRRPRAETPVGSPPRLGHPSGPPKSRRPPPPRTGRTRAPKSPKTPKTAKKAVAARARSGQRRGPGARRRARSVRRGQYQTTVGRGRAARPERCSAGRLVQEGSSV